MPSLRLGIRTRIGSFLKFLKSRWVPSFSSQPSPSDLAVNVNGLTFLISPRCHTGGKYLLIVAAGLLCSLKAKLAPLWFLGAGRLLLVRSSTTAKHDHACHHHQQCPHDSRPLPVPWYA
jgi:hypothetical protein